MDEEPAVVTWVLYLVPQKTINMTRRPPPSLSQAQKMQKALLYRYTATEDT